MEKYPKKNIETREGISEETAEAIVVRTAQAFLQERICTGKSIKFLKKIIKKYWINLGEHYKGKLPKTSVQEY